jgi:hypothetical protein
VSWKLAIPYRDRGEPLDAQALDELPRALAGEDRDVARHVLLAARLAGAETLGDALDKLETASPAERRRTLDRAREAVGLESTTAIEKRRALIEATRWPPDPPSPSGPHRDEHGRAVLLCSAAGCENLSRDSRGYPAEVNVRRFWCPDHEHLAEPGDSEPYVELVCPDPATGLPMMRPEAQAHYQQVYAKEAERHRREREGREAEAARMQKLRAEQRANARPPAGFGPP